MFARISTIIAILFFTMLTAASVQVVPRTDPPDGCSVDDLYCCNAIVDGSDPRVGDIADILGIDLGLIEGDVGINCVPVSVIGASGNNCFSQPACCTGDNFSGIIITDGCSPVNV